MELLEEVKNSGGDLPLEMREVAEKFARLLIVDNMPPTIDTVRQCVHSAEKKLEVKVRLILIDYVQVMRHKSRSIYDDLSFVAKELKSVAKELDVAVVVLSQLPNAFNEHTEPTMASSRDSGVIVEAADNVLALWLRDGESADRVRMSARFIKCRHGGGGKPVPIVMDRTSLRFTADSSASIMSSTHKRRPYTQYNKQ